MGKLIFDNCCFCIDLRVGCFIIGYLNLIGSVIGLVGSIIVVSGGSVLASSSEKDQHTAGVALLVVGIITLLMVAVLLTFAIVLLVGLHKNKPGHVKAYIVYCCIFLVISLVLLIVNLATGPYDISVILSRVIGLLLSTYFVLVIRSYYYQMLGEAAGPTHYNS